MLCVMLLVLTSKMVFDSNVVEKCLEQSTSAQKRRILKEVLGSVGEE